MEYTIVRSDRRTVCIQLTKEGNVVVRAPRRCGRDYIERFVRSKSDWIVAHRQEILDRNARRDAFFLKTGEVISVCGQRLTVEIQPEGRPGIEGRRLVLTTGDMVQAGTEILRLCRTYGGPWLQTRLDNWADAMGIDYQALKLSAARSRWGSCSRDGVIRISVYLLLAPEKTIDYVLVHELAHRRHFDHSRAFWSLVQETMPDYQVQRQVLRRLQAEPLMQSLVK